MRGKCCGTSVAGKSGGNRKNIIDPIFCHCKQCPPAAAISAPGTPLGLIRSTLFYATGGLAYGGVKNSVSVPDLPISLVNDKTKVGWTAGGGVEHLFSNHLTLRGEVRYTDLSTDTVSSTLFGNTYCGKFSNQLWSGTVGLGYKF